MPPPVAAGRAALVWTAAACAAAAVAALLVMAATFGAAAVGSPDLLPPACTLAALAITAAARITLPEARMPASPASMVPTGAIRITSPAGTPAIGVRVAMPAPVVGAVGEKVMSP